MSQGAVLPCGVLNKGNGVAKMNKKTLIAYFSASGVTARTAKAMAEAAGADLYEIRPQEPYTDADLNWMNKKSRSSVEMNDKSFRPAVANKVENMEQYNRVFVGFPIWWYVAPTIINTFLEQYDLTGKKVIPFVTSGSSGMGNTNAELTESCKGAVLCDGRRFNTNVKATELKAWAENF